MLLEFLLQSKFGILRHWLFCCLLPLLLLHFNASCFFCLLLLLLLLPPSVVSCLSCLPHLLPLLSLASSLSGLLPPYPPSSIASSLLFPSPPPSLASYLLNLLLTCFIPFFPLLPCLSLFSRTKGSRFSPSEILRARTESFIASLTLCAFASVDLLT